MLRILATSVVVGLAVASMAAAARGDTFLLANGGQIEGEWLNHNEQPLTRYEIRRAGITFILPVGLVREAVSQSPSEVEYTRRLPLVMDTPESQWELAEWCRKNSLTSQRQAHLRRVVELAPSHVAARSALGYQFLKGEWVTKSDFRRQEGYEFYRGKWRTPQEIEILEQRGRGDLAEKEWLLKLRRLRSQLDAPDKAAKAREAILAIKDPVAIGPLAEFFGRERVRSVKSLYSDALIGMAGDGAAVVLVQQALADPDIEVFHDCIDKIVKAHPPHIADPLVAALKDNDNGRVSRAAIALGKLTDKTTIAPLIEALITRHQQVINNGPAGDTTASFGSGGTFMKKGGGPELQVFNVSNQPVLDALTKMTGVNFGYDQKAWRYWHAQEKIVQEAGQPVVSARRD